MDFTIATILRIVSVRYLSFLAAPFYGCIPNSKVQQAFLIFCQCTWNWSQLSAAECPITGDVFCATSSLELGRREWSTP